MALERPVPLPLCRPCVFSPPLVLLRPCLRPLAWVLHPWPPWAQHTGSTFASCPRTLGAAILTPPHPTPPTPSTQELASDGRAVVSTIHQPSSRLYSRLVGARARVHVALGPGAWLARAGAQARGGGAPGPCITPVRQVWFRGVSCTRRVCAWGGVWVRGWVGSCGVGWVRVLWFGEYFVRVCAQAQACTRAQLCVHVWGGICVCFVVGLFLYLGGHMTEWQVIGERVSVFMCTFGHDYVHPCGLYRCVCAHIELANQI